MLQIVQWKFAGICPDYVEISFVIERHQYFQKMTCRVSDNVSFICSPRLHGCVLLKLLWAAWGRSKDDWSLELWSTERFQLMLRTGRDSYRGMGKRVLRTQQLDPISRSKTLSSPIQSPKNHESPTPGLASQWGSFYICSHKGQMGREDEKGDE